MSLKHTFLLSLCIFFTISLFPQFQQKIDSLIQVANYAPLDTNLSKTYERISRMYLRVHLDSAKVYANKMIECSEELGYSKGIALGNNWLGEAYNIQGNYDTALIYFGKCNRVFKESGNTKNWMLSLSVLANVYSMINKSDSAIILYKNAIDHFEKQNDQLSMAKMKMNLARVYSRRGDYDQAAKELYQARLTFQKLGDEYMFMNSENSLAVLYARMNKSDSAIAVINRIIKRYELTNDFYNLGESYSNLGAIYEGIGEHDKAIDGYKKSLKYRHKVNDPRGLAITEMNLGGAYLEVGVYDSVLGYLNRSRSFFESSRGVHPLSFNLLLTGRYYLETRQFKKSIDFYQWSYELATENKLLDDLPVASLGLGQAYDSIDDYRNALKYTRIYKTHYDSLTNEENIRNQTVAEEDYKHQLQLFEKEQEISFERNQKYFLLFTGIVIVLLLILIILYRRKLQTTKILQLEQQNQINLQNARLHSQMDERKRVANILHDNLAHVILNVRSQVNNLLTKSKDEKLRDKLGQIEENLDFMNKLAKVASYELDFAFVLEDNIVHQFDKYIKRVQHSHAPKISFHHSEKNQFERLPNDVKINVFSVFQEMLGNAIKYAKAGHIGVTLFRDGNQTILQVDDDGIGFIYEEERHGQGFTNMKERAEILKGTFSYESDIGFGTKLKFVV